MRETRRAFVYAAYLTYRNTAHGKHLNFWAPKRARGEGRVPPVDGSGSAPPVGVGGCRGKRIHTPGRSTVVNVCARARGGDTDRTVGLYRLITPWETPGVSRSYLPDGSGQLAAGVAVPSYTERDHA